jgi:hypothetical protein
MSNDPSHLPGAGEYVEWLRLQVHEKVLPATNRARVSAACLALAQEHHHAIVLLVEERLYGSAFALVRVAFEAYVRGQWLGNCATDQQVDEFARGAEPPRFGALLEEVEQLPAFAAGALSAIKKAHWNSMCAYTHSGGLHTQRWQTPLAVEPNYSPAEVNEVLLFAEITGSLSVIAIAALANDARTANLVLERFKLRAP